VSRILNDVLSMQKIEDGALALEMDTFSLEKMIRGALYAFRTPCLEKRLKVRVNLASIDDIVNEALPGLQLGKIARAKSRVAHGGMSRGGSYGALAAAAAEGITPGTGFSGGGTLAGPAMGGLYRSGVSSTGMSMDSQASGRDAPEVYHAQVRGDPYRLRQCLANFVRYVRSPPTPAHTRAAHTQVARTRT
jgi:signal transduction histidine kinase